MIRILIADDHPILRHGLRDFLTRELKDVACGEAADAQQTLANLQRQHWDLLILDVTLGGRSGVDLLSEIKAVHPKIPVLFLSVHPEQQYGKRVLQSGASGYINKASPIDELLRAVQRVLAGGKYVSPALAEWLAIDLSGEQSPAAHASLSDRELEVLRMIGSGKAISQIAGELHLSSATVSTYRARILEKLGMSTTAEIMHYALLNGLSA